MKTLTSVDDVLTGMQMIADPARLRGMAQHGINVEKRLGLKMPEIRALARKLGQDHELALALWESDIHDARILAPMLAHRHKVDSRLMDHWVKGFDSWDVCDQCCNNLFRRLPQAWAKIPVWAPHDEEFVRRAAFALIATLAVHEMSEPDGRFIGLLGLIESYSDDNRNFVRKAVNWALRQIGKRNKALNIQAVAAAHRIRARNSTAARWIATAALRELQNETTLTRMKD